MVQSVFPFRNPNLPKGGEAPTTSSPKKGRVLGFEIALPLTLLVLVLLSEHSPLLKMQYETITDWLCEHDFAFTALELSVAVIPLWMIGVIVYDKYFAAKERV